MAEGRNCIKKKKFLGTEIGSATEHHCGSRGAYVETVFRELFSGTEIGLVTKHHSGGRGWKLYFKNTFFRNENWVIN